MIYRSLALPLFFLLSWCQAAPLSTPEGAVNYMIEKARAGDAEAFRPLCAPAHFTDRDARALCQLGDMPAEKRAKVFRCLSSAQVSESHSEDALRSRSLVEVELEFVEADCEDIMASPQGERFRMMRTESDGQVRWLLMGF